MKLSEFEYALPPELIADKPAAERDHSRLLIVGGDRVEHRHFYDIGSYLNPGDVLVLNQTKVFPARLRGHKRTGGKVEILFTRPLTGQKWLGLVRGEIKPAELLFPENLTARMVSRTENGEWEIEFSTPDLRSYLDRHGEMPLPPYIKRMQKVADDTERYQTVFAENEGAVAAPTAGFHFTQPLLDTLRSKGIQIVYITLHVGWGTFRPVRTESIEDHQMLAERYVVSPESAAALNAVERSKHRVVAVGTTVTRTLESIWSDSKGYQPGSGETNLFITPGFHFRAIDALVTNFHLADSTPLLLACAFHQDPKRKGHSAVSQPFSLRRIYEEAIRERYRFYSYGDAMLML